MSSAVQLSVLVLDFRKEFETRTCLESIKRNLSVLHKTIYLDNGGAQDYCWALYKEGLADVLISKREGGGGGYGQTDLFRFCDTKYALFVQNDQELVYPFGEHQFAQMVGLLNGGYHCVDLNGDQSSCGVWTDRAHLIETAFFNSLGPFPNGGPGENHHLRWNENYLQEVFAARGYQIAHMRPALFADRGSTAKRRNPDGSLWIHEPDTKRLTLLKGPVCERYVYPYFTDQEWAQVLETQSWPAGQIPERERASSFHVWN